MPVVHGVLLEPGGRVARLPAGFDHEELLGGPVDVFTCPDRRHVGYVGESSALEPDRVYNHLGWCFYLRSGLYGPVIVKRDDNQPLTAAFLEVVDTLAELVLGGDLAGANGVASAFWSRLGL